MDLNEYHPIDTRLVDTNRSINSDLNENIEIIITQTKCSREQAIAALLKRNNDIVDSIMYLVLEG